MKRLALFIAIWIVGIFLVLGFLNWLAREPDFDAILEQNPTAAGKEKRPQYLKIK